MKKYSIVFFLENKSSNEVRLLQKKLRELTNSQECLKYWKPHITVGDGVSVTNEGLKKIEKELQIITDNEKGFNVTLIGFGGKTNRKSGKSEFSTPYVLWINVQISNDLKVLVKKIRNKITSKYDSWYQMSEPYTAHVTLAFRDLTKEGYNIGKTYLKDLHFKKNCENFACCLGRKVT